MLTDPIADFLIQIKNGYLARKKKITVPTSKVKESIARLLSKEGYLGKIEFKKESENKINMIVELLYPDKKPKITEVFRLSKPGRRLYVKSVHIPKILGGFGEVIISTSKGFMTGKEARKKNLGGELICKFW